MWEPQFVIPAETGIQAFQSFLAPVFAGVTVHLFGCFTLWRYPKPLIHLTLAGNAVVCSHKNVLPWGHGEVFVIVCVQII
jgi:hypothetical protein